MLFPRLKRSKFLYFHVSFSQLLTFDCSVSIFVLVGTFLAFSIAFDSFGILF